MRYLLLILLSTSFIFSDTIKYLQSTSLNSSTASGTFSSGNQGNNESEIVIVDNVKIKELNSEYIKFSHKKIKLHGVNFGGSLIALSGLISALLKIDMSSDNPELLHNERDVLTNISIASLLIGGGSIATAHISESLIDKIIACKDVVEITDNNGRIIEFDCSNN